MYWRLEAKGGGVLNNTIVLIDSIDDALLLPYTAAIAESGVDPQVYYIGREYFPACHDNFFGGFTSDHDAILKRNNLTRRQSRSTTLVNVYSLVAQEIIAECPNLNFSRIDKVIFSKADSSWLPEELCFVFFSHANYYDLVVAL